MMSYTNKHYFSVLVPSVLMGFIAALQLTACSDSPPGLPSETAGSGGQGGGDPESAAVGGETSEVGETGEDSGGNDAHPEGGSTASGGATEGGAGNSSGGTSSGGDAAITAGTTGQGGASGEAVILPSCMFHTDASVGIGGTGGADGTAGAGGTGTGGASGRAGTAATITLQTSPFVGSYLADATGRTLYTYGNDLPGDCNTPPVSNCVTDCLISWPIFPAGARVLAPGLDEAAFGAILRDDGLWQTTYYGWPIYYYKTDLLLGQTLGQSKAKTWHMVEKKPPAVFIMKPGSFRYLSDASGHTLYVSAADQPGTPTHDPVSNCSGTCLATFEPFHEQNFSVVSSLLISDFGSFVRPGRGTIQVAYKGMPLYRAATDLKSGEMSGTAISGFTAALP